jgi:glycosyltransferase involved in cell wall biosynthesis
MKLLQVTSNYPTPQFPIFGIFMKEQADSVAKLGVENTLFYSNGKENGGMKQHIKSIFTIIPKAYGMKYDLAHCHHAVSGLIYLLSGAALFHKCILSYQNDPDHEYGRLVFKLLYPFFNRIIIKNNPSRYLKYKKVVYLPNGCNSNFFHPIDRAESRKTLNWDNDKIYILYMDSNKGKRTQKRKDRYEAVLNMLKEKFGYDNIVSIELSNTPRHEIPTIMNACNLHLMTSDFEGSPNSVKECLCCNTPVVCTPVGNVTEMMGDIDGCYVTSTFEVDELAARCNDVLKSDPATFNGRKAFLDKGYGIDAVAHKLYDLYCDVAGK